MTNNQTTEILLSMPKILLDASCSYFSLIDLLLNSKDFHEYNSHYKLPAYNTLATGIEIFLKSVHAQSRTSQETLKNTYGHDISKLWKELPEDQVRQTILDESERMAQHFEKTRIKPQKSVKSFPFETHLKRLSRLHCKNGSQFRYPVESFSIPSFEWLSHTFCNVAFHYQLACTNDPTSIGTGRFWHAQKT